MVIAGFGILAVLVLVVWRWPVPFLSLFGKLWGKNVPWTVGMLTKGFPTLAPRGTRVRVSRSWCVILDVVGRKRSRGVITYGCTLGKTIIVRDEAVFTPELVRHELQHVRQWTERGWWAASWEAEAEIEASERALADAATGAPFHLS